MIFPRIVSGSVASADATYTRYKVYLVGQRGEELLSVYLTEFTYFDQACATAREVAKVTKLPVVDSV
jgi:hypothetical protein